MSYERGRNDEDLEFGRGGDSDHTPRARLGEQFGGGTDPENETDIGTADAERDEAGTEAGVGLERGGLGARGEGWTEGETRETRDASAESNEERNAERGRF